MSKVRTSGPVPVRPVLLPVVIYAVFAAGGCVVPQNLNLPAPIREATEPDNSERYYLYVPSYYEQSKPLPLVVTCHGTTPWDTAQSQIQEWADLAERKRFIVAAPELVGTRGDFLWTVEEQIRRQNTDEQHILAVVRHVRAGYSVMPDRVFLTGWSAGSYAVLHTGLRNPNIFRALAVRQGNFDERAMAQTLPFLDHYQPIHVFYGVTDILVKPQTVQCLEWLRQQHMYVHEEQTTGSHKRQPEVAYQFFRTVIQREPLLHVRAFDAAGDNDLAVAFKADTSPQPVAFLWQFGDDQVSRDPEPTHAYQKPGEYQIQLTVRYEDKKQRIRRFQIQVPQSRIGIGRAPEASLARPAATPATRTATRPAG
jgi:predicted esterase